MGQGSSFESGPSGAAGVAPTPTKTCYYELLGVARDATQDDIKKAYKKKALELHPDRNYNDTERSTKLFTEVQAAYEVISDPQERAWYDSHRDAILGGADASTASGNAAGGGMANVIVTEDVMEWFSLFGTKLSYAEGDTKGFFVVVGKAFNTLAQEEVVAAEWEGVDPVYYPDFGGASSGHEDWVKGFYAAWGSFRTAKSFSWCDIYRYSDAPDRRVKRLMEKENKKLRDAAVREFNDTVKSFVLFVRKRDPRFIPNFQTEKQRQAALLVASKEQAARQRAENAAKLRNYKAADWTQVSDKVLDELYDYDTLSEADEDNDLEDGEAQEEAQEEEEEEEEVEEEPRRYECIVCKKTFGSEGPMNAHERSKKHAKAVWELKKQMRKENKEFDLDRDVRGWKKPEEYKPIDADEDNEGLSATEEDALSEAEEASKTKTTAAKSTKPEPTEPREPPEPKESTKTSATEQVTSEAEDSEADNDDYVSTAAFNARLRGATTPPTSDISNLTLATSDNESQAASSKPTKIGKAKAKKAKRAAAAAAAGSDEGKTSTCAMCKQSFESGTKLFAHLRENPTHATPVVVVGGGGGGGGGKKKGKGKRK